MRYSASFILATIISFFVFLGMSLLIVNKNTHKSTPFEMPNFSLMDEVKTPPKVTPIKPTIPEQKVVKEQPPKPDNPITTDTTRPEILISKNNPTINDLGLTEINLPTSIPGQAGKPENIFNGNISCIACIQPNYPFAPARAGIEGWVKVEFIVNQFGTVTDIKVLDSYPKRTFEQATIKAIRKSKFKPLVIDGVPMKQTAVQIIEFKLEK